MANAIDKWWFWFFITIMFMTLCFSMVSCVVGTEAIKKGEYKMIIEAGDNFKQISENVEKECQPVKCVCSSPNTYYNPPYYGPTNWSQYHNLYNWSIYNWSKVIKTSNESIIYSDFNRDNIIYIAHDNGKVEVINLSIMKIIEV